MTEYYELLVCQKQPKAVRLAFVCQCHLQCFQTNNNKPGLSAFGTSIGDFIETLSPILSWKQSIHTEEYLSNSTPTDYQEQTSSALSFHAASKFWTSDELGYIREDNIVSSTSRTDLGGYPSDMPDTKIQEHTSPLHPLAFRTSKFVGSSSGLAGLDSYWHTTITDSSGMGGQQYDVAHYPSWDHAPATANASFRSDFTDASGTCFSSQGSYNETRDEAIQNPCTPCKYRLRWFHH